MLNVLLFWKYFQSAWNSGKKFNTAYLFLINIVHCTPNYLHP